MDAQQNTTTSLDELLQIGSAQPPMLQAKAFLAQNLGSRTFLLAMPMHEFFRMSEVANDRGEDGTEEVTQRPLNEPHARSLAQYMLRGLIAAAIQRRHDRRQIVPDAFLSIQNEVGVQPYLSMQPIVANIRTCEPGGGRLQIQRLMANGSEELACLRIFLAQDDILWVVDGQHRRMGLNYLFEFLEFIRTQQRYPKKKSLYTPAEGELTVSPAALQLWNECFEVARGSCTVQVEIHLGLTTVQERQLFHDLNRLGKKIETGLALEFDSANPVNAFIKNELDGKLVRIVNRDIQGFDDDDGSMARKDVVGINAHLFLNKSNITNAQAAGIDDEKKAVARRFWKQITSISGVGQPGGRKVTAAAQPVVLKALAKLTYDFAFGRSQNAKALDLLLDSIPTLDFSHGNPMWRYYLMTDDQRNGAGLGGLKAYLPATEGNRDIGSPDSNGFMRFGAKHNDIYPLIADMIRWKVGLPSRHAEDDEQSGLL